MEGEEFQIFLPSCLLFPLKLYDACCLHQGGVKTRSPAGCAFSATCKLLGSLSGAKCKTRRHSKAVEFCGVPSYNPRMAFWGKKEDEEKKNQAAFSFATGASGTAAPSAQSSKEPLQVAAAPKAGSAFSSIAPAAPLSQVEEPRVRSALGPGTVIHGKLSFDAPVSIDGKLSGEIFSSKTLHVGKSGTIDATVEVAALVVRGIVKGSIKAAERVEIREGGQLIGEVVTPVLIMEEGCLFNGACSMPQTSQKKVIEPRKEASGA